MRMLKILSVALVLIFAGCANQGLQEVSPSATTQILRYESGLVVGVKPVAIKDNGVGTFVGGLVGAVVGSTIGRGRGSTLASLAGGLGGAYVGNQVAKSNAQELTVQLDNTGENVVVIAKGTKYRVGDHIRIVKKGSKIVSVEAD